MLRCKLGMPTPILWCGPWSSHLDCHASVQIGDANSHTFVWPLEFAFGLPCFDVQCLSPNTPVATTTKTLSAFNFIPNYGGRTKAWQPISPTLVATPKSGSLYAQVEGPHQSRKVRIPDLRDHTKA